MRIEEVLDAAGVHIEGQPIPARRIRLPCPSCGNEGRADKATPREEPDQTSYECPKCGNAIVVIQRATATKPEGAVRLKDWDVIGDWALDIPGKGNPV